MKHHYHLGRQHTGCNRDQVTADVDTELLSKLVLSILVVQNHLQCEKECHEKDYTLQANMTNMP